MKQEYKYKMAATVTKINNSNNILSGSSSQLVVTRDMIRSFGLPEDFIELHISDPSEKIIFSLVPFTQYNIPGTSQPTEQSSVQELIFDPVADLNNIGIQLGDYITTYNVLRPQIVKSSNPSLFIKEISSNRTEIRLTSNNIPNDDLRNNTLDFIDEFQSLVYFKEFYVNFGSNNLLPAVNIALDTSTTPVTVLIKLLDPLPLEYNVNDLVSVVDKISNPQIFEVNLVADPIEVTFPTLRSPNFDLDLDNLRVGPTPYYNFTEVTNFQGEFAPQLQQLLGQLSASNFSLNVDYTDYENFVHYSSAARRLDGFKYKLENIEVYMEASSSASLSSSPISQLDAQSYQAKINSTIQSFDNYEQYLYFESSSYTWPKINNTKPYINYSTTSSQGVNWFNAQYEKAQLYDDNNQNYILYTLPGYIVENHDNELVFNFAASIGQMFDDIWIHIKAITDLYKAKNALDEGISKDLVYFALQSMGINTYTDEDGKNVFKYLYGVDENGNYLPNTGSYETLISASNYQLSGQDQQKGIYKRLYNNLPLLLKSKGTSRFVQYLNTIFGIPSTIMSSLEYGGVDKVTSSFEYEYDRFTYALQMSGSSSISIPWTFISQSKERTGLNNIVPNGIEFRFKASPSYAATQSLFTKNTVGLSMIYTNTGSNDSIYSGSVGNFAYFRLRVSNTSVTSSTIPVYTTGSDQDTSWYSVLVQRKNPNAGLSNITSPQTYELFVKNNIWGEIGHKTSASFTINNVQNLSWYRINEILKFGDGNDPFSGSLQEIRLWSNYISESAFNSHVLNPESIEGNFVTSSYNDLIARFPLGNNLFTYNHFLTSSVASVAPDQNIQTFTASFSNFPNKNNYTSFTETYYADVANSGYANPVTDKIRIISSSDYGTQLLPNQSIQIVPEIPITKDIHLMDASLSPQDEIDRAIIAQFGSTYNLDNIIGNPETGSYNELTTLQYDFFRKFNKKYNYKDYIRLIEFFHNSLFRTLKDFTPARTNLSTGIVIKPHLLERSRVQRYNPTVDNKNNETVTINTAFFTGSNGGDYNQSLYPITIQSSVGPVVIQSDARDFFTGELPSASLNIYYTQSNPFTTFNTNDSYSASIWASEYDALLNNVSSSIESVIRKKTNYITSGSRLTQILEPISLQDFTYDYVRHKNPRYDGVKTTSTNYNVFSSEKDNPGNLYGKNASIDKNTVKFAFFSEIIASGSDLIAMPERSNIYIKYLIDISGSLTELSKRNYNILNEDQKYNLYQVQNIFKSGETINVSLFDKQNPSRQSSLDDDHRIFAGGYKFHPVLFRTGSYNLIYNLNEGELPTGDANNTIYSLTDFIILFNQNSSNISYYIKKKVGNVDYDVNITFTVRVNFFSAPFIYKFTVFMKAGTNISTSTTPFRGFNSGPNFINQITKAGVASEVALIKADPNPILTISSIDPTVISCSISQSFYYGDFTFTGSATKKEIIDYPFLLNKGDLVRFANNETKQFDPYYEYEIIDVYPKRSSQDFVAFKIQKEIPTECRLTSTTVGLYVFSRKIPDETNVVIQHKKKPGQTSGGIVTNTNLSVDVSSRTANIVSELKSKIFSTVLIP